MHRESLQERTHEKETPSPKKPIPLWRGISRNTEKSVEMSSSFELSISLLSRRVHNALGHLLLLCTLALLIPLLAHA